MPLYEYEPENKDVSNPCCYFETLQGPHEAPHTHCPSCGTPIKRKWSVFSSVFSNNLNSLQKLQKEKPKEQAIKIQTESSAAQRVSQLAMGHVCTARCKH